MCRAVFDFEVWLLRRLERSHEVSELFCVRKILLYKPAFVQEKPVLESD